MTTLRAAPGVTVGQALASPRSRLLLVLGDDDLVTGHRASHWTGVAPAIEMDLAFATIAQDGINHADLWYQLIVGEELAGNDPGVRAAVDAIALGREPEDYLHAILCERPPRDIAFSVARHVVVDHVVATRLDVLTGSSDPAIATLAGKLSWELRYHLRHAVRYLALLAGARPEHRARFTAALEEVVAEAQGMFEPFHGEAEVVAEGILPVSQRGIRSRWIERMAPLLGTHDLDHLLDVEAVPAAASGGRMGRHSPDFTEDVWPEMTALYRADPRAVW
jgi:ring-1,2-phenylacetyl-CoA epoxidase subunit PaaC